ncbi:hypothetical protein RF55_10932 [Lasius niger]|uniref:Uncharacterized protein n=1 Tax=Lasius niger TaxID=67767 RepID=A0A0J7KGV4_LASNI|nr:hypothetical protein RF55_10932 [Lasius niger]
MESKNKNNKSVIQNSNKSVIQNSNIEEKTDILLNIGESHTMISMDKNNNGNNNDGNMMEHNNGNNNESVVPNKDCSEEMNDVASNIDVCKSIMLTDEIDRNSRANVEVENYNYQEITDLPTSCDINTMISMDENNNGNNESVMPNKDRIIEETDIASNTGICIPTLLNNESERHDQEKEIDQEITDLPATFDILNGPDLINDCGRRLSFNVTGM